MQATEINYVAVRALFRVWAPIAEAQDISAAADAAFDGGEWSAALNAQGQCYAFEKTCEHVAARFNLTPQQLHAMASEAELIQLDRLQTSQRAGRKEQRS